MPSRQNQTKGSASTAITIALKFVPLLKERSKSFWVAFSLVRTKNVPIIEQITPTAARISGKDIVISGKKTNDYNAR